MTPYDVGMAVVIAGGMAWGAWKGITWQVAGIASLVLGYVVAFPFSAQLAPHLPLEPLLARGLALLVSYVAVSFGVFMVAWSIRATLRRLRFEAYDRHLGMMLGGVEGVILGLVATIVALSVAPGSRATILVSPTGKLVERGLRAARPLVPVELSDMLNPVFEILDPDAPGPSIGGRTSGLEVTGDVAGPIVDEIEDRGAELGRRAGKRIGRSLGVASGGANGPGKPTRRWRPSDRALPGPQADRLGGDRRRGQDLDRRGPRARQRPIGAAQATADEQR